MHVHTYVTRVHSKNDVYVMYDRAREKEREEKRKKVTKNTEMKKDTELVRLAMKKNFSLPLKSLPMMIFDTKPTAPTTP